jgi:hypothetical protein
MKKHDEKGRIKEETITNFWGKTLKQIFYFYPDVYQIVTKAISNEESVPGSNKYSNVKTVNYESKRPDEAAIRYDDNYRLFYLAQIRFFDKLSVEISLTEAYNENGFTITENYNYYDYYDNRKHYFEHSTGSLNNRSLIFGPKVTDELTKAKFINLFQRTFIYAQFPLDEDYHLALRILNEI